METPIDGRHAFCDVLGLRQGLRQGTRMAAAWLARPGFRPRRGHP